MHGFTYEDSKNVATTEFGRDGLEALPAWVEAVLAGAEAVLAELDGCVVIGGPWVPDPEVVGELGEFVESDGAG
jgi:hypothetical protein